MIQRQVPGTSIAWAQCPNCGALPRHIESSGRSAREPMDASMPAVRHSLECRCGRTTDRHATLAAAEIAWGLRDQQVALPLRPAATVTHLRRLHKRDRAARS